MNGGDFSNPLASDSARPARNRLGNFVYNQTGRVAWPNPGINHAGFVQGALLTWEILAHFAVDSISLFYIYLREDSFELSN